MSPLKKNAINLCLAILGNGSKPWNFDENCLELKENLHQLSLEGRYGDVKAVMTEFESRCRYHKLHDASHMCMIASLIPLTLDSAGYFLHPESDEVASAVVKNILYYQSFSREEGGDNDLKDIVESLLNAGFYDQAGELLDGLKVAFGDDYDAWMTEVMFAINFAFGDGHGQVIDWVKKREDELTDAFERAKDSHGCMSVGIELYEAGALKLGAEMIKAGCAPDGYDLITGEELIGLIPDPAKFDDHHQEAYVNYMLHKETLPSEWSSIPLRLSFLKEDSRESLQTLLKIFNSDGRVSPPSALNRVFAAMIRQAQDCNDLDVITLDMNKIGGDMYSPAVVEAITDIIPTITCSRATTAGAPAILYLDQMMNRLDKVDFSAHASLIEEKINEWAPNINLKDFAGYAERIDKFAFDRSAMGASIQEKWPSATETMRELLKDVTPKSVSLTCRALKGSVIERELGL